MDKDGYMERIKFRIPRNEIFRAYYEETSLDNNPFNFGFKDIIEENNETTSPEE